MNKFCKVWDKIEKTLEKKGESVDSILEEINYEGNKNLEMLIDFLCAFHEYGESDYEKYFVYIKNYLEEAGAPYNMPEDMQAILDDDYEDEWGDEDDEDDEEF